MDEQVFKHILGVFGNITPIFVEREEYDNKNGGILEQAEINNIGNTYNIFLPHGMNNIDVFEVVFLLNEKFGLLVDIKEILGYASLGLREIGNEKIETMKEQIKVNIEAIISANNLDKNSFEKYEKIINADNLMFARKSLRNIKEYKKEFGGGKYHVPEFKKNIKDEISTETQEDNKANNQEKISHIKIKEVLQQDKNIVNNFYQQELDVSFFRNGVNNIRYGLHTLTHANLQEMKQYVIDNNFIEDPKGSKNWVIKQGSVIIEQINFKEIVEKNIDTEEQLLREKVKIDEYKIKLDRARESKNTKEIERLEKEVTLLILKTLSTEYPYFYTSDHNGYQPSKIPKDKEFYCLGYSIIGHAFLSELGIEHKHISITKHSVLEIIIGEKLYYCDPTAPLSEELYELNWTDNKGIIYTKFECFNGGKKIYSDIGYSGNVEKSLIYHILSNNLMVSFNKEDYVTVMKIGKKILSINPKNLIIYNFMYGAILEITDSVTLGSLYAFTHDLLAGELLVDIEHPELLHLTEHQNYILGEYNKQNFEGIRDYLLELEQEELGDYLKEYEEKEESKKQ